LPNSEKEMIALLRSQSPLVATELSRSTLLSESRSEIGSEIAQSIVRVAIAAIQQTDESVRDGGVRLLQSIPHEVRSLAYDELRNAWRSAKAPLKATLAELLPLSTASRASHLVRSLSRFFAP
jgi:hypothetical protein